MTTTLNTFGPALFATAAAEVAERLRRSVVTVRSRAGGGAGTIWDADGLIVTNSHVVPGDRAEVLTWDERGLAAEVVARDHERDLAALRARAEGLPAVVAGDSDAVRVGQLVLAVGNPWGQRGSVTAGIILSVGGATIENRVPLPEAIRADVRLGPGNSGGPLVDAEGHVIGINAMVAGGMAVAVPSNTAARFVSGEAPGQGFLGIVAVTVPLPPALAASFGATDGAGLLLTDVVDGSPAAHAGLLPGDLLLSLDGARGGAAVAGRLRRLRPGTPLRLALLRGGRAHEAEAVPQARI